MKCVLYFANGKTSQGQTLFKKYAWCYCRPVVLLTIITGIHFYADKLSGETLNSYADPERF